MKKLILSLLLTCVPICYATQNVTSQPVQSTQYYKQAKEQPQKQPQVKTVTKKVVTKRIVQAQPDPKTKHITKRRVIKKSRSTVVEHHHIYHHHYPEPRRIIVRRVPRHGRVVHHRVYRHQEPMVRHYHYGYAEPHYEQPQVMVRPAPISLSLGYVVGI